MEAAASNVSPIRQLSLDAGGRAPDKAIIGAFSWGAGTKDLDFEVDKGADVRITLVARVTGVPNRDKYDAHGHVTQTVREHELRVDGIESIEVVKTRAFVTAAEAAAEEDAAGDGDDGAVGGGEAAPEDAAPAEEPAPDEQPAEEAAPDAAPGAEAEADPFANA
jgi:hypothetical protein